MQVKQKVDAYLATNFKSIEIARSRQGFSWSPILTAINHSELDPSSERDRDYVRGRFKDLRNRNANWMPRTMANLSKIGKKQYKEAIKPKKIKRLIYDIETSPNIVFSWSIGSKTYLDIENIIQERAIICICYKWEDEQEVHSLSWNNGDDKDMLTKFAKVMNSADEIVTHNGDNFDTRWVRARCMYHGIPLSAKFNSIDTLKLARRQFRLNSNKLTYIAQFLGLGKKMETGGFKLWKEICLKNDKTAMKTMLAYCVQDVYLLEKVYKALKAYSPSRKFSYISN